MDGGAWWATVHGVAKSRRWLSDFTLTFPFYGLEKEVATHSSILAWRIPGMVEPGGLPSMGSHSQTRLKRLSSSSTQSCARTLLAASLNCLLLRYSWSTVLCLISAEQESGSVKHIYAYVDIYIRMCRYIYTSSCIFFCFILSQVTEYSSLCSAVGFCCLSILCIIVSTC